jgi:uncharacterized protein (DUF1778 family)
MKKAVEKRRAGRPPGRKAARRPVLATRVPEDFYEAIKTAARISGRTMSEELIWHTRRSLMVETILDEARRTLADAQHVKEEAILAELARTHTQITGLSGPYWMPKGAKPLQISITPEFKAMLVDAMKQVLAEAGVLR